jgi:hypothetical protein
MSSWRRAHKADPRSVAKEEAKIVKTVERIVWRARVRDRATGHGTLLTESVLVFVGQYHGDFRVFDRGSKQLGVVRRSEDKVAKFAGYEICDEDGAAPVVIIRWPTRWSGISGDFLLSDGDGREIATITTALTVVVRGEKVGHLSLPGFKSARVKDGAGSEVARITDVRPGFWYVAEIERSLRGPLRIAAVVASVIFQEKLTVRSAGG